MLAQLIKEGKKVVVFTGAGMSTESGLPDFRSAKDGMWTKYDPSEVATVDALNINLIRSSNFIAIVLSG